METREQELVAGSDSSQVHSYPAGTPSANGTSGRAVIRDEDDVDVVSSVDDLDYETAAPKQVTAAMLANAPKEKLWRYRLAHTSIKLGEPVYATVKVVNLTDKTLIGALPHEVRKLIEGLFFAGDRTAQRGNKKPTGEQRMNEGLSRVKQIGYSYGCAGFVEPRLVLREQDVRDPERETWVGNVELHDLTEFSRICEGDDSLAARRLEPFPDEPDSAL